MRPIFALHLLLLLFVLPAVAFGAGLQGSLPTPPEAVLFYPDEAQLTVTETLTPQKLPDGTWGVAVILPQKADQNSFFASIRKEPVSGFYWADHVTPPPSPALTPDQEADPTRRELLEKISTLQLELAKCTGQTEALQKQRDLWTITAPAADDETLPDQRLRPMSVEEREKFAQALALHEPNIQSALQTVKEKTAELQRQLHEATNSLQEYDAVHAVTQVIIPLDLEEKRPVPITYGYIMPAICSASYKINAVPQKKKIAIEQFASMRHMGGQEWKNVDISLSTSPRDRSLSPQDLNAWFIHYASFGSKQRFSSFNESAKGQVADMSFIQLPETTMEEGRPAAKPAPTQQEASGFRLWKLGKHTLQHKVPNRVQLFAETLDAEFYYTLRPVRNAKGYLTASLTFEKTQDMPFGQAQFFVDSTAVGNAQFSLNGKDAICFFGPDPLVTAYMRDQSVTKGSRGIINKEQTMVWDWEITVNNQHSWPIVAYVEDSLPYTQEESITIDVESTPAPEVISNAIFLQGSNKSQASGQLERYRWIVHLDGGKETTIKHKVSVAAPKDKAVDFGR